jgi:hypothetical protein
MLKISKHHYLSLPDLGIGLPHPMQLASIPDDDDELAKAIDRDPALHDDNWELSERPDTTELESYWQHVEEDMQNDPDTKALQAD